MYTTFAVLTIIAFCALILLFAFRWPERLVGLLQRILQPGSGSTFACLDRRSEVARRWVRAWGVVGVVVVAVLTALNGSMFENRGGSLVQAGATGFLATLCSSFGVLAIIALRYFVPWSRDRSNLSRCGFRSLWLARPGGENRELQEELLCRSLASKMIGCLDVTGYRYFVKDTGHSRGLLHDVIDGARDVPVLVLLFKPDPNQVDPERKLTSVFNNLLREMELSEAEFCRRIQSTLNAIASLNQHRAEHAKIEVRYYTERPVMGGVLLDESAVMAPWSPREDGHRLPLLEVGRESAETSFYESFRRHFANLWRSPLPLEAAGSPAENGGTASTGEIATPWKASRKFARGRPGAHVSASSSA